MKIVFLTLALLGSVTFLPLLAASQAVIKLKILATSDLHCHILNYDYYTNNEVKKYGLNKLATLIGEERKKVSNTLLIDNGDLLQGNPLCDFVALQYKKGRLKEHPMIKVMEYLKFDVGNLGNHEFNYGLPFINAMIKSSAFPFINSNVQYPPTALKKAAKSYFKSHVMLKRNWLDSNGVKHPLKIAVVGVVPPQIMKWDKDKLWGKVHAISMINSVMSEVAKVLQLGADLVLVAAHSGTGLDSAEVDGEDVGFQISQMKGIDAIILGHTHGQFPNDKDIAKYKSVGEDGTINGVPVVMPGSWGSHLGVIDLELQRKLGHWKVISKKASLRAAANSPVKKSQTDQIAIQTLIKEEHKGAIKYLDTIIGQARGDINSFISMIVDREDTELIAAAQSWEAKRMLKNGPYQKLPLLSAAAPFKMGGRGGSSYFVSLKKGPITLRNVADLYLYPNTLQLLKINGSQVKEWLEMSAIQFNQIDPQNAGEQQLLINDFRSYNFDILEGVSYQIDLTKPPRYDQKGNLINPEVHRITGLQYSGLPIDLKQEFVVAANNYRANGGGSFPAINSDKIILRSPDTNRQVLTKYIRHLGIVNPVPDRNWKFKTFETKGKVVFATSPKALKALQKDARFSFLRIDEKGFAIFALNLEK